MIRSHLWELILPVRVGFLEWIAAATRMMSGASERLRHWTHTCQTTVARRTKGVVAPDTASCYFEECVGAVSKQSIIAVEAVGVT